jgi:hypothetical protein
MIRLIVTKPRLRGSTFRNAFSDLQYVCRKDSFRSRQEIYKTYASNDPRGREGFGYD